nr:sigma-70 family RNA polymerase sigma factor [Streptomyces melanosporofaciens]
MLVLGGVPWDQLDDGVQQVRLKLLENQARPDRTAIREPLAWLTTVASRVAADWQRERSKDAGLRARLAARWLRDPPHAQPDDRALALAVADALGALSPAQRQVLALRYYADLTVLDIAELLGIPPGTVKSRLHHALGALRTRLHDTEVI